MTSLAAVDLRDHQHLAALFPILVGRPVPKDRGERLFGSGAPAELDGLMDAVERIEVLPDSLLLAAIGAIADGNAQIVFAHPDIEAARALAALQNAAAFLVLLHRFAGLPVEAAVEALRFLGRGGGQRSQENCAECERSRHGEDRIPLKI